MSAFNENHAHLKAIELVTAGLQSGVIKLAGVNAAGSNAKNIALDVEYLNGLVNGLAKNLTGASYG